MPVTQPVAVALERVERARETTQLARLVGRRRPGLRLLAAAEACEQLRVGAVGLRAPQLRRGVGSRPARVDDRDDEARCVPRDRGVVLVASGGLEAGVGRGTVGGEAPQPAHERLVAGRRVGERLVVGSVGGVDERDVETVVADVDADHDGGRGGHRSVRASESGLQAALCRGGAPLGGVPWRKDAVRVGRRRMRAGANLGFRLRRPSSDVRVALRSF